METPEQQHSPEEHVEVQETVEHSQEEQVLTEDAILDGMVGHLVDEPEEQEPKEVVEEVEPEPQEDNQEETETPPIAEEPKEPTDGELRQADYTRKMQEIAMQRQQLEPYEVLIKHLNENPESAKQVIEIVRGGPQQPPPVETVPEDPVEALKYEMKQEVLREVAPMFEQLQSQNQSVVQGNAITSTMQKVQADPLYSETHGKLDAYVKGDYAKIHGEQEAKRLYDELDRNPDLYLDMYGKFREEKAPETVSNKPQAPVIAGNGNVIPPQTPQKTRARELKSLKQRALDTGSNDDVASYLDKAEFLNHLF